MKSMQLGVLAAAALMLAGGAQAQSALAPGGAVRGDLTKSDARLGDGSFYDCHALQTRSGQRYRVEMRAGAFDAYLALGQGAGCGWSDAETDDDGAGGTDSRIDFNGDGRVWSVRANSLSAGDTGSYTLTFEALGGAPTPRATGAIAFGQTVRGTLAAGDLVLEDDSFYDCFAFSGRAGEQVEVEMRSGEFDTYLAIHPGGFCSGETLATDDDSAGGTDSRAAVALPRDGVYTIRANSLGAGETGPYQLTLSGRGSGSPAPAAPSRFTHLNEMGACVYERGSRTLQLLQGKTDGTDSVLIVDGREVSLTDTGATQAVGLPWFRDNAPVRVNGRTYVKYGLPRVLGFREVEFFSEYDGVAFAAEAGLGEPVPEVVYALVRSVGCEFQPYELQN